MILPCDGDCSITPCLYLEGRGTTAVEICHHHGTPQTKNRTEYGNYRGISLGAYTVKMRLLKINAPHFSEYSERMRMLPEEQSSFRPNHSATDIMFVVRRLQELAWKKQIPLDVPVCFIDLTKQGSRVC